jgi:hypothetical protein
MMKQSILSAAALILIPTVAAAEAPTPVSFKYDGERYTYTAVEKDGVRVIEGVIEKGSKPFKLVVGKRLVTGTVDGNPVSFALKEVKMRKGIVEVASR